MIEVSLIVLCLYQHTIMCQRMTAWQAVLIVEGYMKGNGWKSMASFASVQILDGLSVNRFAMH